MRLQKVILPAVNQHNNRPVLSYGKINEKYFFAYGSANRLIITDKALAHHHDVRIAENDSDFVTCAQCSEFNGYILTAFLNKLLILTPSLGLNESKNEFPTWEISCVIGFDNPISAINFNFLCTKFIVSTGNYLEIFRIPTKNEIDRGLTKYEDRNDPMNLSVDPRARPKFSEVSRTLDTVLEDIRDYPSGPDDVRTLPKGSDNPRSLPIGTENIRTLPRTTENIQTTLMCADGFRGSTKHEEKNDLIAGTNIFEVSRTPTNVLEGISNFPTSSEAVRTLPRGSDNFRKQPIGSEDIRTLPTGFDKYRKPPIDYEYDRKYLDMSKDIRTLPKTNEGTKTSSIGAEGFQSIPTGSEDSRRFTKVIEDTRTLPIDSDNNRRLPTNAEDIRTSTNNVDNTRQLTTTYEDIQTLQRMTEYIRTSPISSQDNGRYPNTTESLRTLPITSENTRNALSTSDDLKQSPNMTEDVRGLIKSSDDIINPTSIYEYNRIKTTSSDTFQELPNTSEQNRTFPSTSEDIRQHPITSENIRECPSTSENTRQIPNTSDNTRKGQWINEDIRIFTKTGFPPFRCQKICTLDNFSPAHIIEFTTDGLFFATANFEENCVKVWYSMERVWKSVRGVKALSGFFCDEIQKTCELQKYLFVYLPHPRPIVSLSWRRKCLFSNFDIISNVLLTSCLDGVGRVWAENLFDMKVQSVIGVSSYEDIAKLPLDHELHLNNSILKRVWPYVSFHVIIILNDSHINLQKTHNGNGNNFVGPVLYWLNNKEIEVMSYCQSIFEIDFIQNQLNLRSNNNGSQSLLGRDLGRAQIEMLNRAILQWHTGPDIIYSVSPINGSLLTWSIENLDLVAKSQSQTPNYYFLSSISTAFPINLVINLNNCFVLHDSEIVSNLAAMSRHLKIESSHSTCSSNRSSINSLQEHQSKISSYPEIVLDQSTYMYTSHQDGSFNVWKIEYSDQKSFSSIHNVSYSSGIYGSQFEIQKIVAHPHLPVIAILSQNYNICKTNSDMISAQVFIWRVIPVISLINPKDTWILQGIVKVKNNPEKVDFQWIPSTSYPFDKDLSFVVSSNKGIGVFQVSTYTNDSCLGSLPENVPDMNIIITGLVFLGTVLKSKINLTFLTIEQLCVKNSNSLEIIFIIIGVADIDKYCNLYAWEISLTRRDSIENRSNEYDEKRSTFIQCQQLSLSSSLLTDAAIDFKGDIPKKWHSLRNTSFYNPYECNESIFLAATTHSEDIIFVEVKLSFDKIESYIKFKKLSSTLDYFISVNNSCNLYDGLKRVFEENVKYETTMSISFCSPIMMAYFGFPNDIPQNNHFKIKKVFILRIFSNRLAGIYSWKQETCMLLPFTDFDENDFTVAQLVDEGNKMSICWCSLDNGEHLLSVVIFGKLLIFSSCPQKGIEDQPTDKCVYQSRSSSLWSLLSTIDLMNFPKYKMLSTWFMGNTFFVSHGKIMYCYISDNHSKDLHNEYFYKLNPSSINEVSEGLNQSRSLPLLNYLNLQCFFLIDQISVVTYILLDLYKYFQMNVHETFCDNLSIDHSYHDDEFYIPPQKKKILYKPPKIFQIIKESYSIEKIKDKEIDFTILEKTLDQYLDEIEPESIIFNDKTVKEIELYFKNISIEGLDINDQKYIPILAKCMLETVNLSQKNKNFDPFTIVYFNAAKFHEYLFEEFPLNSFNYLCSFYSKYKRELLDSLGFVSGQNLTWEKAKKFGLGWWCFDIDMRRLIIECIAKSEFQKNHEVLDSSIFYLLLQKKSIIPALFKSQKNNKMYEFFSQNFIEEKTKLAASKNAFHLLTLHRYAHSLSFFILAGQYSEAIQVAVNNMDDLQLGFLIAVSCPIDSQNFVKEFIQRYLLGEKDRPKHPDQFLRSIGYLMLKRYAEALMTLVDKCQTDPQKSSGINDHPVIKRIQILWLFRNIKSHEGILEFFRNSRRRDSEQIFHNDNKVTQEYVEKCYERLICSCVKFTLNHGLPYVSNILSLHQFEYTKNKPKNYDMNSEPLIPQKESFLSRSDTSLDSSISEIEFEQDNLVISKSYLFISFMRCLIEDIKSDGRLIDLNNFLRQIKFIVYFCVEDFKPSEIQDSLNSIIDYIFKGKTDFVYLYKYSYFISILIRHFSLYVFSYSEILNDLFILHSDLESYSSNEINQEDRPPFPSLVLPIQYSSNFIDNGVYINKLASTILSEVFKTKQNIFLINNKQSVPEENVFFENLYQSAIFISKILFRVLGGDLENFYLKNLSRENKKLYLYKHDIWQVFSGNIQSFYDEVEAQGLVASWTYSYDCLQSSINGLLHVYETYLCFFTCLLMYALYHHDAKLCIDLLEFNDKIINKWALLFGSVHRVSLIPQMCENDINKISDSFEDEDVFELFKTESSQNKNNLFNIFIPPTMHLHDILSDNIQKEDSDSEFDFEREINEKINYAWSIMISSILCRTIHSIKSFLHQINLTSSRIFSYSPITHSILAFYNKIRCGILSMLDASGNPPKDFLPFSLNSNISKDSSSKRILDLMKLFMNPENSPFQSIYLADEAKLWNKLVIDEKLNNEMLLFSYPIMPNSETSNSIIDTSYSVLHCEPNGIYQFCYDLNNSTQIAMATQNKIVELKISYGSVSSIMECESCHSQTNQTALSLFLEDIKFLPHKYSNYYDKSTEVVGNYPCFSPVMIKQTLTRKVKDTYLIESHKSEPYYISAVREQDVCLFQYGVDGHLHQFDHPSEENSKYVHLLFNDQGNKFGTMDEDGYLSVYLFNTSTHLKPYFRQRCHNKYGTDFCFLGTSSLIAASGHSSDGIDVSLWDTLMPPRSRLTRSFLSHEHGCTAVGYSPNIQSLIIGGRKGGLSIYDLRRQKMLTSIPMAHDSAISCLAIDNSYVSTGSYDGVVKLWKLTSNIVSPIEISKNYVHIPIPGHKVKDLAVRCIRMQGKYLFSSLQGCLSIRVIEQESFS